MPIVQKFAFVVVFLFAWGTSAQENARFIHLEHRISDHTYETVSMVQDTLGYMWVSNINGISKYNGYKFEFIPYRKIFKKNDDSDRVELIVKDALGTIWVISAKGDISMTDEKGNFVSLSVGEGIFREHKISHFLAAENQNWIATEEGQVLTYDPKTKKLAKVTSLPIHLLDFNGNSTLILREGKELYIFTNRGRLFAYDIDLGELEEIEIGESDQIIFNTAMVLDGNDRLWLSTSAPDMGLLIYDLKKKDFVQNEVLSKETLDKTKQNFSSILSGSNGMIWAGTDGNGLYRIDPVSGKLKIFNYNIFDSGSLSSNTVIDIYEDHLQNLWIANNYGTINILLNKANIPVKHHSGAINNSASIVLAAHKDKEGTLWFGTDGKGMIRVPPDNGEEEQFLVNEDFSNGFYIEGIIEDDRGNLWISSQVNGVWIFNKRGKTAVKHTLAIDRNRQAYVSFAIFNDSKDRIWIATELGIFIYDGDRRLLAHFDGESMGFGPETFCRSFAEDTNGVIWLGQSKGLFRFDEDLGDIKSSRVVRVPFFDEQKEAMTNQSLRRVTIDNADNLWIVNNNGNLFRYSQKDGNYTSYSDDFRFRDIDFKSAEAQGADNIWLGSNNGLWHLNFEEGNHITYFKTDGFLDNSFQRSSYKDAEGNLYFGSRYGINYFDPETLAKKKPSAKLYIENIEILNQPAISIIPDQITTTIQNVGEIELEHSQSSFSFNFVAIDNVLNPSFYYSYRLKGFNDNWTNSYDRLKATYTNVPPGRYEFQLRAGSYEGNWDFGEKVVKVDILPPFYKQTWAYVLYVLIALSLVYALYGWIRLNNKLIAEELEHKRDKELYDLKMNFFAKVSHEIQTPLTLINVPIENMLNRALGDGNKLLAGRLKMIANNAKRLSRIVFELTTVRNKELGRLRLRASRNNIVDTIEEVVLSFRELAQLKAIRLRTSYPEKKVELWYDKDKIEHILYNLLSNAIKFTPKGGEVILEVNTDGKDGPVRISVKDSGPGIPQKQLANVFDLFYQAESDKKNLGMGIGLALVKDLIHLHRGKIDVTSSRTGTCFTITLSTREDTFTDKEKLRMTSSEEVVQNYNSHIQSIGLDHISVDFSKTILIVEDNFELQEYLKGIFGEYYKVLCANNGEEGFELAKKHGPNLILSDIMMPVLNGIDMSEKLRKNKSTSHIPVILLTAEKTRVNKIMALRVGAIEYLRKPFNVNELILKTNNIITRSDRLRSKFKTDLIGTPRSPESKSKDDVFLEDLVERIENRMGDPDFKVEELSDEMHISYSVIYKKFQALTGKTIVDFVRSMRLRKAAMYLTESNFSVSESAFAVGFNDPKYFSKCFKKEFDLNPLEYKKRILKG